MNINDVGGPSFENPNENEIKPQKRLEKGNVTSKRRPCDEANRVERGFFREFSKEDQ